SLAPKRRREPDRQPDPGEEAATRPTSASSPARSRFEEVVGTSRRARILTALTVLALAVAVVAFIVLRSDEGEGGVPQDAYLRSLDRQCVQEKARLSDLEDKTLRQKAPDFTS